ncbi:hypothetical protein RJ639_037287 [Escallonia herrerae]|uniref:WRKY domain-containing protein n=1 Tax=Escallonia herrerae TaxID=1293975 RepID=A0AA89B7A8_9ASTE|nr:hypothetical protein RJ639_037287 [Escallonia herrerae]
MDEEESKSHSLSSSSNAADAHGPDRVRDPSSGASGSNGAARYKLMSPAKLPISRSVAGCISVPPGLSPTSFLESPVLLSNIKFRFTLKTVGSKTGVALGENAARFIRTRFRYGIDVILRCEWSKLGGIQWCDTRAEPSPTTGSFFKPQLMHGSGCYAPISLAPNCSGGSLSKERKSTNFEFKPHVGSNSVPGFSSTGLPISTGLNHQKKEPWGQVSFASSPLANGELTASKELSSSAPLQMLAPRVGEISGVDYDDMNHRGHPESVVQVSQSDHKDIGPSVTTERSSDDGYNWRKYGQKLVKGCEFPRSYYKCTHPNCEVKKIFERSYDGQITEIVYKGMHDHPKPQPSRRFTAGALMSIQEEKAVKVSSLNAQEDHSTINAKSPNIEPNGVPVLSPKRANDDSVDGPVSQLNGNNDEVDEDDPFSKRRKTDVCAVDIMPVVKPIREPRVVVQTVSEVDILDDGYRWRKYGQKVVRGNPNPRSYYKCTNAGCPVRKHVERASHDPKAVITTYEGKHNHDVPTARNNSHDMAGLTAINAMPRMGSEKNATVSLDLGVGITHAAENRINEQRQKPDADPGQSQVHVACSNIKVVQATPASTCYGGVGGGIGMSPYGSREKNFEGHSLDLQPLSHSSNQYPQNLGKILLGP